MRFTPLTLEERAASNFTHRFDFSYADIPAGIANNTAQVFSAAGSPAGWQGLPALKASDVVVRSELHITQKFQSTTDSGLNTTPLSFGDAGSATRFFNAVESNQNGSAVVDTTPGAAQNQVYTAASQLSFTIGSMAAKTISNLNRGKGYILLQVQRFAGATEKLPPFAATDSYL